MSCKCPKPELCEELQQHINGRLWEIWNGINITPITAKKYRSMWRKQTKKEFLSQQLEVAMPKSMLPINNMVQTPISGLLSMSLDIEVSLSQFGRGKLCYNTASDSWLRQSHQKEWDCFCELSCRTRSGAAFWHLTFRLSKKGKRSDLMITFMPNNFRNSGDFLCDFTVKDKDVQCDVATQDVVVNDNLGVFKTPVVFKIKA